MIQQKFKHTLSTQQIVVKTDKGSDDQGYIPKVAGAFVPLIRFYDETIEFDQIEQLTLAFGNSLLPTVSITLNDVDQKYMYSYPVKVGNIFTCFLGQAEDTVHEPIKGDFYLTSAISGGSSYYINGVLNLPKIYEKPNRVFVNKTSLEVLEQIAKECQLGFATNIDSTNDRMNWVQYQQNIDFIQYLMTKIYVNDTTYVRVFIDQYWNLNVIDVEKAINTSPFETFKTNPNTGEVLEEDVLINASNLVQSSEKFEQFVYDGYSMNDDYTTIALTEAKNLEILEFNTSTLVETSLTLNSPHIEHITKHSVFSGFSNDNTYKGYFQSKIRNSYNTLMTKGQQFSINTSFYIAGMYLYMSYEQSIYNPQIHVGKATSNTDSTLDEDQALQPDMKSYEITKNQALSGEVMVTGMSIQYDSTMQSNTSSMKMNLNLFLKPRTE